MAGKTRVIVDGYNVLKTTPQYASLQAQSLEAAREALIIRLSQKASIYDITVVFDAWDQGLTTEKIERTRGVRVIYSRRGEQADDVIVRLAGQRGHCIVITKDGAVRAATSGLGQDVADPEALFPLPRRAPVRRGTASTGDESEDTARRGSKKGPSHRPKKRRPREGWRL